MVGDYKVRIVTKHVAEAFAFRTGAEWMIEGKQHRPERFECPFALLAEETVAVGSNAVPNDIQHAPSIPFPESCFDRFGQARTIILADYQAIQDDVECMMLLERRLITLLKINNLVIGFDPSEAPAQ